MPLKARMFCTKCGASLSSDAKLCPKCGAQVFAQQQSSLGWRKNLLVIIPVVVLGGVLVLAAIEHYGGSAPGSSGNLVEAANDAHPDAGSAGTSETSIGNLFMLPHADTGFAGSWGGHLQLVPNPHNEQSGAMPEVPMSYYFGEQNGTVFLKTSVYGDPKWPVVNTAVKVLSPQSVELKVESECKSCTPPDRQQVVTKLTLINPQQLQAESANYDETNGNGQPQITYKGTLHLMTPAELTALAHEVEEKGKLQTTINSKGAVP